jgi:hypothetical protein
MIVAFSLNNRIGDPKSDIFAISLGSESDRRLPQASATRVVVASEIGVDGRMPLDEDR